MNLWLQLLMSQMMLIAPDRPPLPVMYVYLCQLKTYIHLGKAVHHLRAAGSTPGSVTDQQYYFGQDLILSSLYSLPFYLFNFFFLTSAFLQSFSDAVSATLGLVKSYVPQISGICFCSSK